MREMRKSNAEWLGTLPAEWEETTIGTLYDVRNEKVSDVDFPPLSVTMKGVVPQLETAAKTDAHDDRKLVREGDFCINSRSDRRGSCGIADRDGSVSLINTILSPRRKMNPNYYNWLFHTSLFADEFYRWGHGIVDDLWTTRWQEMKNISVPVPSDEQQEAIAQKLDEQVAKVNTLIANQEAQIEKLKAYKQSLITETVTKGLDKSAPMKDSGVEWIGEIPEGWEVTRVGHLFEVILGKMISPEQKSEDDTLENYFCAANVHFEGVQYDGLKSMWFSECDKSSYLVKQGDLLVVEGGAGAGGASIVDRNISDCYVQNSIMIVRQKASIPEKWLYYYLFALVKKGYIDYVCHKATIPHFTKEKLSAMPIAFSNNEAMVKMIDFLDDKCQQVDALISVKQQKIEKLNAYKKSLIYEYVTGKKEVNC